MLRRLKLSLAAVKTAISRAPAARARSKPSRFGTSTGSRTPGGLRDAPQHLVGARHLRHPLRRDEGTHLDDRQARGDEPIAEGDPLVDAEGGALVLQPVAGADLDDA